VSARGASNNITQLTWVSSYAIQSNRVVRRYKDHGEHFLRVDFRDEDRLQYRWEREVDGKLQVEIPVGGTEQVIRYIILARSSGAHSQERLQARGAAVRAILFQR
jgi:hypothetical protein